MNTINSILLFFGNRTAVWALVIGLIVGLLFGWLVMSWVVPTYEWTDAAPVDLSYKFGYQQKYLTLLADHYVRNPQIDLRVWLGERWTPKEAAQVLDKMAKEEGRVDQAQLKALATALRTLPEVTTKAPSSLLSLQNCALAALVVAVLAVGVFVILPRLRGGGIQEPRVKVAVPTTGTAGRVVTPEAWTGIEEKPVSQFVTTYVLGDNRYDMSFSVESGPDFLGECGVAISETIGIGDPDKVTALEVWLFDKNDIRTITKVLMSEHCYNDEALRGKLAAKGEAELISPGGTVILDTQTLRLRARVVDIEYGSSTLPPNSFFNKVTLELAAWPKPVA